MKRATSVAFVVIALLSGCAGIRTPKLAKCAGPFRYANPYGTVLPSLPISGQLAPSSAPQPPASVSPPTSATPANVPSDPPVAAKTSALLPHHPSC